MELVRGGHGALLAKISDLEAVTASLNVKFGCKVKILMVPHLTKMAQSLESLKFRKK